MVAACASGEAFMAQVWLTFEEIQDLFGCDAADARRRVIANQWERRRGTDGVFRAQLPPDAAHQFMFRYGGENASPAVEASNFEAAMAALRRVFAEDEGCGVSAGFIRSPSDAGGQLRNVQFHRGSTNRVSEKSKTVKKLQRRGTSAGPGTFPR